MQNENVNDRLKAISAQLYGDKLELRVVNPRELSTLKRNARYMAKPMFDQLTQNIRKDGQVESVPLVHTLKESGKMEIISGNHRVQAAIEAGINQIVVLAFPHELERGMKLAKQLSHNALAGQADQQLLVSLWSEIDDIEQKLYAGLDSVQLGELTKVNFSGFGPEQIATTQIALWFVPEEVEQFERLMEHMEALVNKDTIYLVPLSHYDRLFKLLVEKKKTSNIKNVSVAFMELVSQLEKMVEADKARETPVETLQS